MRTWNKSRIKGKNKTYFGKSGSTLKSTTLNPSTPNTLKFVSTHAVLSSLFLPIRTVLHMCQLLKRLLRQCSYNLLSVLFVCRRCEMQEKYVKTREWKPTQILSSLAPAPPSGTPIIFTVFSLKTGVSKNSIVFLTASIRTRRSYGWLIRFASIFGGTEGSSEESVTLPVAWGFMTKERQVR